MAREFKLPDIGEGVEEGEIVNGLVKEGQPIKENDLMVEVMTDKVTVQIPSPVTGKVLQIRAKDGEVVKVGQTIIVLGEEGETAPAPSVEAAPRPSAHVPPPPAPRATPSPPPPTAAPVGPALATPAVRKLAREVGVNIDLIRGTGPGGRVTEEDVRAASRGAPAITPAVAVPELAPTQPVGPEERIPIHGLRRRIAEKMAKSKATASHFTYVEEGDMTQLVHLRDRLKEGGEQKGVKLTYLPFIVKAVVAALKEHPTLNASMEDANQETWSKRNYNM